VSAAAFKGVALFIWTRHYRLLAACGIVYAMLLIGTETLHLGQARGDLILPAVFLILAPLLLPLSLFMDSGRLVHLDLTNPVGLFPRIFFVLPAAAHQIVLPFMLYAALLASVQWLLAAAITHHRPLDVTELSVWLPACATSFVTWVQAVLWTPARHRYVRALQLFALLCAYIFVFVVTLRATLSRELTLALSMAQFPIAYAVAVHGVAKCRRGEPSSRVAQDRNEPASGATARRKRGMAHFASPLDAQLWMELRTHRWVGKSSLVALIPGVLLIVLLIAKLKGADHVNSQGLGNLGEAVINLLFGALGVIGIATGLNFGSFGKRTGWSKPGAYLMPPYLAALPFTAGDFAWAKMRAAVQRILWVSAGIVLTCAAVAKISGVSGAWVTGRPEWRAEYGLAASLALTALPYVSIVMLVLSATASVMVIVIIDEVRGVAPEMLLFWVIVVIVLGFVPATRYEFVARHLQVIVQVAAIVKLCGFAALVAYVGSGRVLSWRRLTVITGFWVATAGTVLAWLTWYAPQGLLSPASALCAAIGAAPVLGALAAPVAMGWNRVR
jgi:hypothetical protein